MAKSKIALEKIMGRSNVYELRVYDFLEILDPPPNFDLPRIDPQDYFITSGDAIQKAGYLISILWEYAGNARKQLNKLQSSKPKKWTAKDVKFEKKCWEQAGAAQRMQKTLEETRGEDIILETEWNEHRVLCIPKNPRKR